MQYIMYVFLKNFRIGLLDSITSQTQHPQEVLAIHLTLERSWLACTCLFFLCVNLLTGFFVFLSVSFFFFECTAWNRWRDLHFPCIFVFSIIKAVLLACHDFLLLFLLLWFSNRASSLMLYFYEVRGTIEKETMLLTTAIQRTSPTLKL